MFAHDLTNVILSITFIAVFISIFFFTYGTKIEKDVVQDQVKFVVEELTTDLKVWMPSSVISEIKTSIDKIQPPDTSAEDQKVKDNNDALIKKSIPIVGGILFVGMAISIVLSRVYKFSFTSLFIQNIIILIAVAITEFCFLTFIGKNYRSLEIVNNLRKFSQS